jgi:hypothetical protein
MKERRVSGRRKEDGGCFNLPTSVLVILVVMATLMAVNMLTTL